MAAAAHFLESLRGAEDAFPGSELLATVYMYPAWGWIERVSRGVEVRACVRACVGVVYETSVHVRVCV